MGEAFERLGTTLRRIAPQPGVIKRLCIVIIGGVIDPSIFME